jgi:hypothetical protein
MRGQVHTQLLERREIKVLNVRRRWFEDDLELIVMGQPVGVLSIAPVGGTDGRLYVRGPPWPVIQAAQEGSRVEGPGAHLGVIWLHDDATLPGPVILQGKYYLLKGREVGQDGE